MSKSLKKQLFLCWKLLRDELKDKVPDDLYNRASDKMGDQVLRLVWIEVSEQVSSQVWNDWNDIWDEVRT